MHSQLKNNQYASGLERYIHQLALATYSPGGHLKKICEYSLHFNFSAICTTPIRIAEAKDYIGKKETTKLIALISFPFGESPIQIKRKEAEWSFENGADQIDIVPNINALMQGKINLFAEEIASICELGLPTRVILNTKKLEPKYIKIAIEAAIDAGVIGIQSTDGFGQSINANDINQLKKIICSRCEIKAVGGIKNLNQAFEIIEAGATNIGTSFGKELIEELRVKNK